MSALPSSTAVLSPATSTRTGARNGVMVVVGCDSGTVDPVVAAVVAVVVAVGALVVGAGVAGGNVTTVAPDPFAGPGTTTRASTVTRPMAAAIATGAPPVQPVPAADRLLHEVQ